MAGMPPQNVAMTLKTLLKSLAEPVMVAGFVLVATTAIAQPFYVPTGSMEPTIQIGDVMLGSKFAYGYSRWSVPLGLGPSSGTRLLQKLPRRGDVVVFRLPRDPKETLVKRVIGLPGDTVQMIHGRLILNGRMVPLKSDGTGRVEDGNGQWHGIARFTETLPGGVRHAVFKTGWDGMLDDTGVYTVPAGHLFMMGDNRDNSLDSRVPASEGGVGFVPVENLMARADVMLASYDFLNARGVGNWLGQFRLSRFLKAI